MLTAGQIREARALLRWDRSKLARRSSLPLATIERAETGDGEAPITVARQNTIRQVLSDAGIEFSTDPPGVRLREREP